MYLRPADAADMARVSGGAAFTGSIGKVGHCPLLRSAAERSHVVREIQHCWVSVLHQLEPIVGKSDRINSVQVYPFYRSS